MRVARWIAVVLAFLALPLLVVGLIDPLEGGVALLTAGALGGIIGALSRVAPPKLLWIAYAATMVLGAIVIGIAVAFMPPMTAGPGDPEVTVQNPLRWLFALNWVWRLGVVVTAVGWVMWIVRLIRAAK